VIEPSPSRVTHTLVIDQVQEINDRLAARRDPPAITADELGLCDSAAGSGETVDSLPAEAVLSQVCCIGTPEWPYIHGHFRIPETADGSVIVDFHTPALRELSHRLRFRHIWGE